MGTEFQTGSGTHPEGRVAGRAAAEEALSGLEAKAADFTFVSCSPSYDCDDVVEGIRSIIGDAELVGLTSEGGFTERNAHTVGSTGEHAVIVAVVASDEMRFFTGLGRNLSEDLDASIAEATADIPTSVEGYPHQTGLLLSSSFFGYEMLAMRAYQKFPIQWAGGGAFDTDLENLKVFAGDQTAEDAVSLTVIASKRPQALGVDRNFEPIGGSLEVTKSDGSVVYELDGQQAYDVWKRTFNETARERFGVRIEEIEQDTRQLFEAFAEMLFGVRTGGDEYKIRCAYPTVYFEPYSESQVLGSLPNGALRFPYPIPEGMILHPMTPKKPGALDRGKQSVGKALADISEDNIVGGLVFDCPSGELILGEGYQELIDAIAEPINAPVIGIQSGDQLCYREDDMRGVHEAATSVVLFNGGGQE